MNITKELFNLKAPVKKMVYVNEDDVLWFSERESRVGTMLVLEPNKEPYIVEDTAEEREKILGRDWELRYYPSYIGGWYKEVGGKNLRGDELMLYYNEDSEEESNRVVNALYEDSEYIGSHVRGACIIIVSNDSGDVEEISQEHLERLKTDLQNI